MNSETGEFIWLREPAQRNNTQWREDQRLIDFLKKPTLREARTLRQFLNYNLERLPQEACAHFVRELERKDWDSTFFELITARTLQLLGAAINVEEELCTGKRPDFRATFEDGEILVEATRPAFQRELRRRLGDDGALCRLIESLAPEGFSIHVRRLPRLDSNDSKREFKWKLKEEFGKLPPPQVCEQQNIQFRVANGDCELQLWARQGKSRVDIGACVCASSDAQKRIERAVKGKREQVRDAGCPDILAINATRIAELEDFDTALYGRSHSSGRFSPDGSFAKKRAQQPTYAGVLAYFVEFPCVESPEYIRFLDPVLYVHPRWEQPLPSAIRQLRTRVLEGSRGIRQVPASISDLLGQLRPDA